MTVDITVAPATPIDVSTVSAATPVTVATVTLPPGVYLPSFTFSVAGGSSVSVRFDNSVPATITTAKFGVGGFQEVFEISLAEPTDVQIVLFAVDGPVTGTLTSVTFLYQRPAQAAASISDITYLDWKDAVIRYTEREDLRGDLDTILRVAQRRLARELYSQSTEFSAALPVINGRARLPADYKDIRSVTNEDGSTLVYVGAAEIRKNHLLTGRYGATSGPMSIYAIEGRSILVAPVPTGTPPPNLVITYVAEPPRLIDDEDTHIQLQEAFDLYVKAGVAEIYNYVVDREEAARYEQMYQAARMIYNAQQLRSRMGSFTGPNKPRPGLIV